MHEGSAIEAFFDALNAHDMDRLRGVLTDDFVFEGVAGPGEPSREALTHEIEIILGGLPDLAFRPVRRVEDGGVMVVEFRAMGTHSGPFLSVPPTNTFAIMSGVFSFEQAGGGIHRLKLTIDFAGLRRQLLMAARSSL